MSYYRQVAVSSANHNRLFSAMMLFPQILPRITFSGIDAQNDYLTEDGLTAVGVGIEVLKLLTLE